MKKEFELHNNEIDIILPELLKLINYKPKTSGELIFELEKLGYKLSPIRFRAIIHHIRVNEIKIILGGRGGYWVSDDPEEIFNYCQRLDGRADSIKEASSSIRRMIRQKYTNLNV